MASIEVNFPQEDKPSRVKKWKVSKGTTVTAGRILMLYQDVETGKVEKKLKAPQFGRIVKLLVKDNEVVQPGQQIAILEGCTHPTVMKDLCAECGADLREEFEANPNKSPVTQANVPMVHSVPELKVTAELAEKIGREDKERLLKDKRLVLLVDLDQTIVHTTNDNVPANMEDVHHYQLYGPHSPWYHTRLRPHTRNFLAEISKLFELHICTFGARQYAHKVASILDEDGKLFSHRILSRDECFDPQSKTANLKALFPCGVDMVCIIDDRDDVWQGCANLVQVKPYHFFLHTGDIHSPPGLEKRDLDPQESDALQKPDVTPENRGEKDKEKTIDRDKNSKKGEASAENSNEKTDKNTPNSEENEDIKPDISKSDNPANESKKPSNSEIKKEAEQEEPQLFRKEDHDDYLLYLEDILKRIHKQFYDSTEAEPKVKTLREIIPRVKSKVLQELTLTFSGLIPNNQKIEQNRAYKVARAFGAKVSQDLTEKTTHLVAIQPGTLKVRDAKKNGKINIVNPDWLWTCAERWEHVDERLYPLREVPMHKAREFRKPPAHCSTPEHVEEDAVKIKENFANSINPLMTFTQEEIDNMGKEVEEDMSDLDDDEDEEDEQANRKRENDSDSNDIYGYDESYDDGPKPKRRKKDSDEESSLASEDDQRGRQCDLVEDEDDDDPVIRFRRGEDLPDDLDLGDNSQDSVNNLEAEDMEDDREWNAMGAALEREFMSE